MKLFAGNSNRVLAEAVARYLNIPLGKASVRRFADQAATHVLKGYFSTMTEGKDTTVIYVWDIYDPAGNRLHRINGQQKAPSVGATEGWPAVAPATMQAIADQTIDQFAAWLGGSAG